MPRGFCGGSGTIQDGLSFLICSLHFFIAHLASRVLNCGMHLLHKSIHFEVQFSVSNSLVSSWLGGSRHSMRTFLRRISFFGHTVYPTLSIPMARSDRGDTPLDYARQAWDGSGLAYFSRFAQRALAAFNARSLRSSGVRVTRLRLPPIRPPFLPIADITRDTARGILRFRFGGSGSSVGRCTV